MVNLSLIEAEKSVLRGGGPFGAIIVSPSRKIIRAYEGVTKTGDTTAHAEVVALRKAKAEATGGTMYSSCEPCPMCASASAWAKIARIYYVISILDLKNAGSNQQMLRASDLYRKTRAKIRCNQVRYRRTKLEVKVRELLKALSAWLEKSRDISENAIG